MLKPVKINYTSVAEKELRKLTKETALRILNKVLENTRQPDILARAKPLTGRFAGMHRYRIGEYRVVFVLDATGNIIVLTVLTIKHPKTSIEHNPKVQPSSFSKPHRTRGPTSSESEAAREVGPRVRVDPAKYQVRFTFNIR